MNNRVNNRQRAYLHASPPLRGRNIFKEAQFKGTVSGDVLLQVYFIIICSRTPASFVSAISIIFENSRRYSQLKELRQRRRCRWQITIGIIVTSGKFTADVNYISGHPELTNIFASLGENLKKRYQDNQSIGGR